MIVNFLKILLNLLFSCPVMLQRDDFGSKHVSIVFSFQRKLELKCYIYKHKQIGAPRTTSTKNSITLIKVQKNKYYWLGT